MRKLSFSIILSTLLIVASPISASAEGQWVPNPNGLSNIPGCYFYNNEWFTAPPSTPGKTCKYNGQIYIVGNDGQLYPAGSTTPSQTTPAQTQPVQPAPTQPAPPAQAPQTALQYYYDGTWHANMPTEYSKSFWYNGQWCTTPAAPQQPSTPTQRPSAYVDNTANSKAQELVNYAVANGVAGSYADSTDSATQAQKHITFTGQRGSFDMTLTTHVGSDGSYVTKYWRAGIERSLTDIQSWILGCR